jgi:hypothetical protein
MEDKTDLAGLAAREQIPPLASASGAQPDRWADKTGYVAAKVADQITAENDKMHAAMTGAYSAQKTNCERAIEVDVQLSVLRNMFVNESFDACLEQINLLKLTASKLASDMSNPTALLSLAVRGASTYQEGYELGYDTREAEAFADYEIAYTDGMDAARTEFQDAYNQGKEASMKAGFSVTAQEAYDRGFAKGMLECACDDAYDEGFKAGRDQGVADAEGE